jgi:hypothetical protein
MHNRSYITPSLDSHREGIFVGDIASTEQMMVQIMNYWNTDATVYLFDKL